MKTRGRPWRWPLREIVNAIVYVMRSSCPWRLLPVDLPPWSTVCQWFVAWRDACVFEKINHALVMIDRERTGCDHRQSIRQDDGGWWSGRKDTPTGVRSFSNRIARAFRIATAVALFFTSRALYPLIAHVFALSISIERSR